MGVSTRDLNRTPALEPLVYRGGEQPLFAYLRQHAKERPDAPAIYWYGRVISWRELDAWSDKLASFLYELGVRQGDRVALYLQNCPQYHIAHYAIQKIGAVVGPCSPMFKEWELAYEVADLGAKVLVSSDLGYPVVSAVQKELAQHGRPLLDAVILTSYSDLLPAHPTLPLPEDLRFAPARYPNTYDLLGILSDSSVPPTPPEPAVDLDDVALLVYTSGTTGKPKGAMLTYRNALFKTAASAAANGIAPDDVFLAVMPMFHIAGMLMALNIPIYSGRPVVLLYRFDPETVLKAIEQYRCTWWYSTAPMNQAILDLPNLASYDLRSLRNNLCTSFGTQVTEALADAWRRATGGCALREAAYGLSETHTADTFMPADRVKWGTVGLPVHDTEIRIVDLDTGAELPAGSVGEIVIRGPGVFKGYWRRPEATAQTLQDGWLHTGDMGSLDEDGYLTFHGRFKEMIKVSGYSVFPEDVEGMLIRHPAVAQAAVVGVPDAKKGQSVKAFVVLRPDVKRKPSAETLRRWARDKMAPYKVPKEIVFRDALPASGTGKVLRRLLLEE
ncbi:AMP-binding protein [Alicyclobacillus cycloheptanicus]|nr:AMP-binding protein [Alicyclobacillus cycloheptanicus]